MKTQLNIPGLHILVAMTVLTMLITTGCDKTNITFKTSPHITVDSISTIMDDYYNSGNYPAVIETAKTYLKEGIASDDKELQLLCATSLSQAYYSYRSADSAKKYSDMAMPLANELKDTLALCSLNSVYGFIAMNFDADLIKATSYFMKCLEYTYELGDSRAQSIALANLVMAYYNRGDISGLKYAEELYDKNKNNPQSELFIMGATSCAFMYSVKGDYTTALRYIEEAFSSYGPSAPSTIYALYGSILSKNGNYKEADRIFKEGMKKGNPEDIYLEYGEFMLDSGKYGEAVNYLLKGLNSLKANNMSFHAKTHYFDLSQAYEAMGQYDTALKYYKAYDKLQDSIFTLDKESAVNDMLVKYEAEQKDREIQAKELQLVKESKKLQITAFILILSFIVIGAIYLLYKRKNLMYRQIVRQHQEYLQREKLNLEKDRKLNQEAKSDDKEEMKNRELFLKIEKLMKEDGIYKNKDLTIDMLTDLLGNYRSNISKIINTYSGMTFNNYINSFRINRAVDLLTETDMPVKVLVDEVGFNSPSAFFRVFKQVMGVPPSRYREEAKSLKKNNNL